MQARAINLDARQLSRLLRGEPEWMLEFLERWRAPGIGLCLGVICLGAGLYGGVMGYWRSPLQAVFVALKFPLIVLLTTLGNALLNAMLAPLLGLNISFRQSLAAILMSFTIAAAILGSFSPLMAFILWNTPAMSPDIQVSRGAYSFILLTHVGVIAFAGIAANLRLVQLLRRLSGNAAIAHRVLIAWLAGNLFLGAQLSWILRPFIGSPQLPVQFLRQDAFHGNFYETVFRTMMNLLTG